MIKETIVMPTELSAENGGKGLMIGEFSEVINVTCTACAYDHTDPEYGCEVCDGEGSYTQEVTVGWDTIKDIYAKAVDHFGGRLS